MPWTLVFLAEMHDKKNAIIEERRITKLNRKSLEKLINSEENQISTILVD
jgi:predicted GIY-YIG superfamily endonuclease